VIDTVPAGFIATRSRRARPATTSVSLQARVIDASGNITEQAVIDAYLLG
jgi:hypothetical protein